MIHLTLDTDWAPEHIVEPIVSKLTSLGTRATVFATGPYDCLISADPDLIKVGLHPAVSHIDDLVPALKKLRKWYPEANAVRVHSLVHSSRYWRLFHENGVRISSNTLLPGVPLDAPVHFWPNVVEYPITFMDDYLLTTHGSNFSFADVALGSCGMQVFAFHFIHIYLNSRCVEDYVKAKPFLQDAGQLKKCVQPGYGVGVLFDELVVALQRQERDVLRRKEAPQWIAQQ